MTMPIDQTDYSVVVKRRAPPPNSWRWEIYRAGRRSPIEQSSVYFETMTIPRGCDRDNLQDKTCEELKRSGMEIESEFDAVVTMCNSGCVYALIGGTTHLVPPWVKPRRF
jgi:hypothetical protein